MIYTTTTLEAKATYKFGSRLGTLCRGGETIELVSDLGGGKTVFVQGLAAGLGYQGEVTSPTFVISRDYALPGGLGLHHFDLYRIAGGDMAAAELAEFTKDSKAIVAVEWASNVTGVLPDERIVVELKPLSEDKRQIAITTTPAYDHIIESLNKETA